MRRFVYDLFTALQSGEQAALCTVLDSAGSSPRGAGARMAVFGNGRTIGTVGGGAAELQAIREALDCLRTGRPLLRTYQLVPGREASVGMICGGTVTVCIQPLGLEDLPTLDRWLQLLERGADFWLRLTPEGPLEVLTEMPLSVSRPLWQDGVYLEPVLQQERVYLFGGGHVGQALVPVLARIGFRVVVFDRREALARPEVFPEAEQVILGEYLDIFAKVALTERDYAVVMTPGHQADFEILDQVLRTKATYVGCIGSRRKAEKCREMLRESGFSQADIDRIHSPIGLPILAETPEEIAISIAAEMIRHRAEHRGG